LTSTATSYDVGYLDSNDAMTSLSFAI